MPLKYGVTDGSFARVTTDYGQCTLKVVVSERQQRGMLFAPIHWSEANATSGPRRLAGGAHSPIRFPASPRTRRRRRRSRHTNTSSAASRCRASRSNCPRMPGGRASPSPAAMAICSPTMPTSRDGNPGCRSIAGDDLAEYKDFGGGIYRARVLCGRPHRDLPVHRSRAETPATGTWSRACSPRIAQRRPAPHAAVGQIGGRTGERRPDRLRLLRRRPHHDLRCHRGGAAPLPRSARRLKAGTNCGSCIPELKRLIAQSGDCGAAADRSAS